LDEMAVPVFGGVGRSSQRKLRAFIRMFRFARGATGGMNVGARHDDDGVVGDASFAWTVVIHNIAQTQRSLLHQILTPNICVGLLPDGLTVAWCACSAP